MSRSGYSDDIDQWALIRWRGAVASAVRGKRGQAFLRELAAALDAMPEKRLARNTFARADGCTCALGSVAVARGVDVSALNAAADEGVVEPEDVGALLGIPRALAAEIMFTNDDEFSWRADSVAEEERRWWRVRKWVESQLATDEVPGV